MSQLAKKLGKIGEHTDGSIAWMEHVQEFIDEDTKKKFYSDNFKSLLGINIFD